VAKVSIEVSSVGETVRGIKQRIIIQSALLRQKLMFTLTNQALVST